MITLPLLKKGWKYVPVVDWFKPIKTGVLKFQDQKPYYSTGSVKKNIITVEKMVSYEKRPSRANRLVEIGDVLQARMKGSDKAVLVDESLDSSLFSTGFVHFRPGNHVLSKYLYFFFKSDLFLEQRDFYSSGSTQVAINDTNFKKILIPMPPNEEEIKTISEIVQNTDDSSKTALSLVLEINPKITKLRTSMLEEAFSGRLVFSEANSSFNEEEYLEHNKSLRDKILLERMECHKADSPGKKYKHPVGPVVEKLPPIPQGWIWTTLDELTIFGPQNGIYKSKDHYGYGTPIIRIDDFQVNRSHSSSELQKVKLSEDEQTIYSLNSGDLVINRVNSPSHLGKCMIVSERNLPAVFESNMMRLRLCSSVLPNYIQYYLNSFSGKSRLISNAKWAVNQASINQRDVANTPVPLPPLPEQVRILEKITHIEEKLMKTERLVNDTQIKIGVISQSAFYHSFVKI